jgi:hypothetical protein
VKAIMVVENLQRPLWFRRLESFKGRVFPSGTYGIMQVESARPVSDEESIKIAVETRLAGQVVPFKSSGTPSYPDHDWLLLLARAYNDSQAYAKSVATAYSMLQYSSRR